MIAGAPFWGVRTAVRSVDCPVSTVGGHYSLDITISTRPEAFIRPTGTEFPGDDPAILNDPTTVPSDLSRTPELGNRKILTPY